MPEVYEQITKKQRDWAGRHAINLEPNYYFKDIDDNLFGGLDSNTRVEFEQGSGHELGESRKMYAPWSSSALVTNFFQYWRRIEDIPTICAALSLDGEYGSLTFEKKLLNPTGRGKPNLDVELSGLREKASEPSVVGIESKFTELYRSGKKNEMENEYLNPAIWGDKFQALFKLASEIHGRKVEFANFDAAQALKHMLGMFTTYSNRRLRMICLWYEVESSEAKIFREKLDLFKECVADSFDFVSLTYQELFQSLRTICGDKHSAYMNYLEKRYLS